MAVGERFWSELTKLKEQLIQQHTSQDVEISTEDPTRQESKLVDHIEQLVRNIIGSLSKLEAPVIRIPKTSRDRSCGGSQGERILSAGTVAGSRQFTQMMTTLASSYMHLKHGSYATIRDVYYEETKLYGSQSSVSRSLEDLSRVFNVPRRLLHLTSTGKGLVAGNLMYTTYDNVNVDVSLATNGLLVPENPSDLTMITSDARYILLIEKDATFQKLIESQFHRSFGPCILITGKGYPDLTTRLFVRKLWDVIKVPVLALTDADPYGVHIAAVYKFGALGRNEPNLTLPSLVWLGVLPSDVKDLQLPPSALITLTPQDHGKLATLAADQKLAEYDKWLYQINILKQLNRKAEIQSLTHISPTYLVDTYLPMKIRYGGWVL